MHLRQSCTLLGTARDLVSKILAACACGRQLRVQPGTAGWAQLCPSAWDEAAAVAQQASQLAETAAELAAAQVAAMTHICRASILTTR